MRKNQDRLMRREFKDSYLPCFGRPIRVDTDRTTNFVLDAVKKKVGTGIGADAKRQMLLKRIREIRQELRKSNGIQKLLAEFVRKRLKIQNIFMESIAFLGKAGVKVDLKLFAVEERHPILKLNILGIEGVNLKGKELEYISDNIKAETLFGVGWKQKAEFNSLLGQLEKWKFQSAKFKRAFEDLEIGSFCLSTAFETAGLKKESKEVSENVQLNFFENIQGLDILVSRILKLANK